MGVGASTIRHDPTGSTIKPGDGQTTYSTERTTSTTSPISQTSTVLLEMQPQPVRAGTSSYWYDKTLAGIPGQPAVTQPFGQYSTKQERFKKFVSGFRFNDVITERLKHDGLQKTELSFDCFLEYLYEINFHEEQLAKNVDDFAYYANRLYTDTRGDIRYGYDKGRLDIAKEFAKRKGVMSSAPWVQRDLY
jgi:hypothetical protein